MRYILDTHILIWLLTDDKQLKGDARHVLANGANYFYVSVESLREIVIKSKLSKANFKFEGSTSVADLSSFITDTLKAKLLPTTTVHVETLERLKTTHNDPFDHLLICQAIAEGLIMISADGNFPAYQKEGLALLAA